MAERVICGNCGGKVPIPDGHTKAKIRCVHCGYYAEVPAAMRAAAVAADATETPVSTRPVATEDVYSAAKVRAATPPAAPTPPKPRSRPRVDPADTRPEFLIEEGSGTPLLEGTQEEDDDLPYAVPGTGLKPCPHCRTDLPLDATFCVHCGEHLSVDGKRRPERTYEPLSGFWHEGWSWETRVGIVIGLQVVNLFMIALFMKINGQPLNDGGAWTTNLSMNLINIFLQVFIIGSYEAFSLNRTETGKTTMYRHRRIGFTKLPQQKVKWKKSSGAGVLATHNPGAIAWIVFFYLLLCGIVPGIVFYWMVIRPERFSPALCDEYRCISEVLLKTKSREEADTIAKVITNATNLRYHKIL